MHDMGSTRDQKLIFLNSGDNIDGKATNFSLQFPSERFTAEEPAKMRLNLHQFQMKKIWPDINPTNRRFFMAIKTNPDQPGNTARYRWFPIDLVESNVQGTSALAHSCNAFPVPDALTWESRGLNTDGIQAPKVNYIYPLNIKDIFRCPRTKFPSGGTTGSIPPHFAVNEGNSSIGGIQYSYSQPLADTKDLRSVLEYSINMRLYQIAYYTTPYDTRYDPGGAITWLQRYTGNSTLTGITDEPCLAVQVHFTEQQRFEIYFCNGLPNMRYPLIAPNILGSDPTVGWNDVTGGLLVRGQTNVTPTVDDGASAIYFCFPQFKDGNDADFTSGIRNDTNQQPAWPDIPIAAGFSQDPLGTFNDCNEVLGAWCCRANQPSTVRRQQFNGLTLPLGYNEVVSGLVPITAPRTALLPAGDSALIGWRFPSMPTLQSMRSINIHASNVMSNNYESIDFTQGHNKSQQKTSVPSTLFAKIPLPVNKYHMSEGEWSSPTVVTPTGNPQHRPTAHSEMICQDVWDKVSWEAPWSTIFGITLDNPVLNQIQLELMDEKDRPFSEFCWPNTNSAPQGVNKNLLQNNAGIEMTICFHNFYVPPIPRDEKLHVETQEQTMPTDTLLGGANTNVVMESDAQMAGSYFADND